MEQQNKNKITGLVIGLSIGLLFMGLLRFSGQHPTFLTPLAGLATPGYVLITVLFTILLVQAGLLLKPFGFGGGPDLRHVVLAVAAIAVLRLFAYAINPLIEEIFGASRNLARFSGVEGSLTGLLTLLIINWTFAAFGEEFAYRIVLMRGLAFVFGDSRAGQISAIALQAFIFGLIHAYQGPTGIVGSAFSGLVFGFVTLKARWSIWPAALAHGANNTIGIIALYYGQ